ncbi:type II toxin-antitoxin system HicA family toxin [Nitrosomonas sp.]|uniref:type II toxin-antitoxin system HicA family toxin n=1 Tax=Nitrosomonas sp. TaxID=42353 RepID=UPI0025E77715|nr:type II toxin-antitoxin system HicA family toxin [Nitrosomonas sp.]
MTIIIETLQPSICLVFRWITERAIDLFKTVCTIHNMSSKEIIKQLEKDGWILRGTKGSHHVYTHPEKSGHISVPHPKKDLGIGLSNKLLKQAGLK